MSQKAKRGRPRKRAFHEDRSTPSRFIDPINETDEQPKSPSEDKGKEEPTYADLEKTNTTDATTNDTCDDAADDSLEIEEVNVPEKADSDQNRSAFTDDDPTGFRCVDVNLLAFFVSKFPCPNCQKSCFGYSDPKMVEIREKKTGLASVLEFICGSCGVCQSLTTSAKAGPRFEVNSRFNAAMFLIGNDSKNAKRFCSNMKMPDPLPYRQWMNKNT